MDLKVPNDAGHARALLSTLYCENLVRVVVLVLKSKGLYLTTLNLEAVFYLFCLILREDNLRQHSKPGSVPHVAERKKHAVAVVE